MSYKSDFPIFKNRDICYLDSAATTLKPSYVIDSISEYMRNYGGSPHRGAHDLSIEATGMYENSKMQVKKFLNATEEFEVVYTQGTTSAINLVSSSITREMIKNKDNVVISINNHHSNLLPWQKFARDNNLELRYIYEDIDSDISKIDEKTSIVAFPQVVNTTGFTMPVEKICRRARESGALILVDGAQAVGHHKVDLTEIDCDFYTFSAHKIYGPTGIGALVAKRSILDMMQPYHLGGDMIEYVTETDATFAPVPEKFEAGTQNTMGAFGLLKAIEYIQKIGLDKIIEHENKVYDYAYEALSQIRGLNIVGDKLKEANIISFTIDGIHPHDIASILNEYGVMLRAGHHCTQPLMKKLCIQSSCRMSLGIYNEIEDIDKLVHSIAKVKEIFGCQ